MLSEYSLIHPDKAHKLAEQLNSESVEDGGWSYTVVEDPLNSGYAYIEIYDDGVFIGRL